MKLKTERDLSYIDPLTVEFFQNNGTSSISVILLTNGGKDGMKKGRTDRQTEFNTSLKEVILLQYNISNMSSVFQCLVPNHQRSMGHLQGLTISHNVSSRKLSTGINTTIVINSNV